MSKLFNFFLGDCIVKVMKDVNDTEDIKVRNLIIVDLASSAQFHVGPSNSIFL